MADYTKNKHVPVYLRLCTQSMDIVPLYGGTGKCPPSFSRHGRVTVKACFDG